jgi:malonyl-CoA O-methyltransferase
MSAAKYPALSLHDAYERWAERYPPEPHNPLMRLEQRAMASQLPPVARKVVLDLGCGTGRYSALLEAAGAATVVGVDFSRAMLRRAALSLRVQGDMVTLPFRAAAFDLVVSGLAMGHATDIYSCAAEVARVLRPMGTLVYSDFHPEAGKAGLERSWKEGDQTCALPPGGYEIAEHRAALTAADLKVDALCELRVGIELQERFNRCEEFYRRWHGLPIVFVIRAHR